MDLKGMMRSAVSPGKKTNIGLRLHEVYGVVRIIEAGIRMVVARAGGEGDMGVVFNRSRV